MWPVMDIISESAKLFLKRMHVPVILRERFVFVMEILHFSLSLDKKEPMESFPGGCFVYHVGSSLRNASRSRCQSRGFSACN